jgi:hypothetical protein
MLQAEVTGGIHMPRMPPSTAALISVKSTGFNGIPITQADGHFTGLRFSRSAQRSTSSWTCRATCQGRPGEMLLKRIAFMPARLASCAA